MYKFVLCVLYISHSLKYFNVMYIVIIVQRNSSQTLQTVICNIILSLLIINGSRINYIYDTFLIVYNYNYDDL